MSSEAAKFEEPQSVTHRDMANAIRALSMDAVQKANSGHPGMPMGMADVATVLYTQFLKYDPQNPTWPDRDRFVLSAGHGSMLLYAINYLTGYEKITLDDIKNFRQLGRVTAGHPEYDPEAGIETTTGPLGQGIANGVGMALAEKLLAARFGKDLVNHYTYVIAGDGCMMEGISHEACSFAGHLGLGRLILLYDDNGISIDGPTSLSFSEDIPKRFESYGWHVLTIDGHNPEAISRAIAEAQIQQDKPSLICCKTKIGYGAPNKEGTASSHGSPLGDDEIAGAREALGWPHAPFEIPDAVLDAWRSAGTGRQEARKSWQLRLDSLDGNEREKFDRFHSGKAAHLILDAIDAFKKKISADQPKLATRQASGNVLEEIVPHIESLIGGSADLTGSNNTLVKEHMPPISREDFSGRYIYYGVREHAMAAVMNGMALHRGLIPYSGTFLCFTDYCRPSIRLSALMKQRVVYVMTHDSIGLGEDGPTHQPVEHLASLRAMPNLLVMRPADAVETAECWQIALEEQETPSVLSLTRQGLPTLRAEHKSENLSRKGAYILAEAENALKVTVFASGSETHLALDARKKLEAEGVGVRVVSVPCFELFFAQDEAYRKSLLGNGSVKIAIEAACKQGWEAFIGTEGIFIGMESFGDSAPAEDLYKHFGITAEAVVKAAQKAL